MSKTKYTKENHLKHFEEQLAFRDSFIEKEAKYLENKRDELGISTYEKIAELCFALHMQDEIDDDGYPWTVNYMYGKIFYNTFNQTKDQSISVDRIKAITDIAKYPDILDRFNIDLNDLAKYAKELLYKAQKDFKKINEQRPYKKSPTLHITRCTSDLFKEMQKHNIPAKKQINFVISIYAHFKYYDYHLLDNDKSKFKRVEKQRERALKDI